MLGGGELGPDVAREIGIGGLPGFRFRVVEDQIAQFGDDLLLGLAVERGDERQVHRAALVQRDQQSFLGAADVRDGRGLADHVLEHDGGFGRLARHLVVILQGHDQHGVRVFPEFHEVGHAADDAAVGGFAEGRLVDRAIGGDELVIGPVQFPAGVVAVRLGPAFVLGLQDAAGAVTQAQQGGKALAGHRAVGLQRRAAIDDRHGLTAFDLMDGPVLADEETSLGDVAFLAAEA